MSQTALKDLISLAENTVKCQVPDEASIQLIADYCDAFDAWAQTFRPEGVHEPQEIELLKRLEVLHPEVIKTAQLLLDKTSDSLKLMKVRGKSILAYAEAMPRQMGPFSGKKP